MKRSLLVVSFSLLVLALVFSRMQRRSVEKMQKAVAVLLRDQIAMDERLRIAEERLSDAQKKRSILQFTSQALQTPPVEVRPLPAPVSPMARVNNNPHVQNLRQKARRATLDATYAQLFRRLQLSPEKIDAFKDLILRQQQDWSDLTAAQHTQGLSASDPGIARLHQQLRTDYEGAQFALLGGYGLKEWREYERTSSPRDAVSAIAGAAVVEGIRFSAETAEKLIHLIAANSPDYAKGRKASLDDIDWEIVDAQAQIVLSPEQFAIFTTVEPPGLNSEGVRSLPRLNRTITKAVEDEKASRPSGG